MNILNAIKRSKTDRLESIRNNGMIPAVVYGARVENTLISVSSIDFKKILKIAGESNTIILELKNNDNEKGPLSEKKESIKKIDVLIHEVQVDPVKGFPIHIDFLAIDINKPVEVTIPLEFIGIASAEKNSLGVLVKVLYEIQIEALPKDLPHNISVDLSLLNNLNDQIHVKDIIIPKNIRVITEKEEVVALIAPIKEEIIEEVATDLSSIEVEKKGKKEGEEEGEEQIKE